MKSLLVACLLLGLCALAFGTQQFEGCKGAAPEYELIRNKPVLVNESAHGKKFTIDYDGR